VTHPDQAERAVAEASTPTIGGLTAPSSPFITLEPSKPRSGIRFLVAAAVVFLVAGLGWVAWSKLAPAFWRADDRLQNVPRMTVAKVDMSTVLTAWGRVESSKNTIISCELERLEIRTRGQTMSSGGASTILTLIEEGTEVKKDDVLCTLDASEYEELVRTQEIKTEQADAARKTAQLNLEVGEIAVKEYREGLYKQQMQSFEGMIVLSQADKERAVDRLKWTEKMLGKGYASVATKATDQRTLDQSQFDLMSSRSDLTQFLEYGNTKTLMELTSEVEMRRYELIANTLRVTRNRDQLALYKRMVEHCTIKAPHDGFLIYAYDPSKPYAGAIEEGMTVRQGQKLFFLPDLANMEVMAYIHESVAGRVHEGMKARARIEGLQNRALEGTVISVGTLPTNAGNWWSEEVKYFVAVVKLDAVPGGVKPGMSAEVEFDVDTCLDVLAVPSEAVSVEGGRDICYVAGVDGLERRMVKLGRSNRDLLEVKQGLAEGDQVVLRPEMLGVVDPIVAHEARDSGFDPIPAPTSEPSSPAPAGAGPISVE
jgi:HlyD family secretion protein